MAGFILPIVSGLAGLFGGKPKQQTSTTNTKTEQNASSQYSNFTEGGSSGFSGTQHQLSPFQNKLAEMFTGAAGDMYNQSADLSGYAGSGLRNINAGSDATNKILQNTLAARGLSFSPAAATSIGQSEQSRVGKSVDFLNSLPLLQRQLQQQSFGNLIGAFSALPTDTYTSTGNQFNQNGGGGQQSESTTNQQQTQTGTQSGNPAAGALGGLGAGIAANMGNPMSDGSTGILGSLSRLFGGG